MQCEHCTKGYPLDGEPVGAMQTDGSYLSAAPIGAHPGSAVVLLSDVFGLKLKNPKIQADMFAKALDVDVLVPDMFNGRPIAKLEELEPFFSPLPNAPKPWFRTIRFLFLALFKIAAIIRNRPSVVEERCAVFLKKIKEERKYERIGVVGYCFGGSMAVRLGGSGLIHSAVIAHPGSLSLDQIRKISVPTSWECAEEDESFKPKIRQETEAILVAKKDIPCEFRDYKGTTHGFATRPALQYPEIKAAYEAACNQTVNWFAKTII